MQFLINIENFLFQKLRQGIYWSQLKKTLTEAPIDFASCYRKISLLRDVTSWQSQRTKTKPSRDLTLPPSDSPSTINSNPANRTIF